MLPESKKYIVDTTFWEDYFIHQVTNVRSWGNTMMTSDSPIVITSVILIEFVDRLYYVHKKTPKQIKEALFHLRNIFRNVVFPNFSEHDVREIVKDLQNMPIVPRCHSGELSFLNLTRQPNVVTVSSDSGVLTAYTFTERIDPRQDPPTILHIGETYSSG